MQYLEENYLVIFVCGVLSMVIGYVWYGPLFGKKMMELSGSEPKNKKTITEMQQGAGTMYFLQFLLALFHAYYFSFLAHGWDEASGIMGGMWTWAAFIMPTVAGSTMWTNETPTVKRDKFLIYSGYQLVLFVVFGIILGLGA